MINLKSTKGFTLVELMFSMVFGLFVLSGVTYIYVAVVTSSSETLKQAKINSQLMTVMSIMVNDIRRSGYWANSDYDVPTDNPFNDGNGLLTIRKSLSNNTTIDEDTDDAGSCLLYSYDRNEDGDVDTDGVNNEHYGFRLSDGVIQLRSEGDVSDGDSCSSGTWYDLTDSDLYTIRSLQFNPKNSSCVNSSEPNEEDSINDSDSVIDDVGERDCYIVDPDAGHVTVETREIEITIQGYLNTDTDVRAEVVESVRVRNDRIRIRS